MPIEKVKHVIMNQDVSCLPEDLEAFRAHIDEAVGVVPKECRPTIRIKFTEEYERYSDGHNTYIELSYMRDETLIEARTRMDAEALGEQRGRQKRYQQYIKLKGEFKDEDN